MKNKLNCSYFNFFTRQVIYLLRFLYITMIICCLFVNLNANLFRKVVESQFSNVFIFINGLLVQRGLITVDSYVKQAVPNEVGLDTRTFMQRIGDPPMWS